MSPYIICYFFVLPPKKITIAEHHGYEFCDPFPCSMREVNTIRVLCLFVQKLNFYSKSLKVSVTDLSSVEFSWKMMTCAR